MSVSSATLRSAQTLTCGPVHSRRRSGANRDDRQDVTSRSGRVLVVEDDFLNALMVGETLQFQGHHVLGPARTIAHALELLANEDVDAALLDLQIDNILSIDVAHRLDELGIPWAIMTAHSPKVVPAEFSAVPRLGKPFALPQLLQTVEGLLAEGRHSSASRQTRPLDAGAGDVGTGHTGAFRL